MARVDTSKFLERGQRKRPPNSPGYETNGKQNFNHKVEFKVDYSDYSLNAKEVDSILSQDGKLVKDFYKFIKRPSTGTSGKTFFMEIEPRVEKFLLKTDLPGTSTTALPDGYKMGIALQNTLSELGKRGKGVMRKYVIRNETGLMQREIRYEARKRKDYSTLEIGWIRAWHKYFGFQEDGFNNWRTGKRVEGMRSVLRTALEMAPRFQREIAATVRKYIGAK